MVAAPICLVATVILISYGMRTNVQDASPLFTILSFGVYSLLLFLGDITKPSRVVSFIAKHSFSIYLVHMMVLLPFEIILPILPGPTSFLMHIGVTLLVFAASTAIAFVLDEAIINPAKAVFDKIFKRFLPKQKA